MRIDHPTPSRIPHLRGLWKEAFGDSDAFLDGFFSSAFSPSRCLCAWIDGALAGALYWFDVECEGQPMAYIYAVATVEQFRNRGICRALMAEACRCLAEKGCAGTILVPEGDALRKMYGKMGFRDAASIREFSCTAGPEPAPIHRIGEEEFRALRRRYLPWRGVVQEGENLSFLQTQAEFYAGQSFLLAARKDADCLTAVELLGNTGAAPGILTSLGCSRGSFRTPGEGKPFAMFLPLKEDAPTPQYFALAFD